LIIPAVGGWGLIIPAVGGCGLNLECLSDVSNFVSLNL
jgi:hypothetical protein